MVVIKRNGEEQLFDITKIEQAIRKVFHATGSYIPHNLDKTIAENIVGDLEILDETPTVEIIQDLVEDYLIIAGQVKEAKAYIRYRQERTRLREEGWQMDELQFAIWNNKYRFNEESFNEWLKRVSGGDSDVEKLIRDKKFLFGGRILANRGLQHHGKKVSFSNCYVLPPPEDTLESIYDTARDMAKTYAYGGGVGINLGKLRPRGMEVNNSAKTTTGAVSFMSLYDLTTGLIGQANRRGALMLSIPIEHPDAEEFIDVKTKQGSITKANVSIQVTDEFMKAVRNKSQFDLHWEDEHGRSMTKTVNAHELFMKNVKNNWDWAEAGFLFWDSISDWHMLSEYEGHEFAGTNPCGELPLIAGGSCLLGSLNISEFIVNPFTDKAYVDLDDLEKATRIAIRGLNDVLDEGEDLHPLQVQRDAVRDWRQIGLGIMGLADALIKVGIKYGSDKSARVAHNLMRNIANWAVSESARIAEERGSFGKFDFMKWKDSDWVKSVLIDKTIDEVRNKGLRNSQILAIAPTGSISTMLGVSGGVEPIFAKSYTRKTESIHNEDVFYEVYQPIVAETIKHFGHIPDYVVTAHDIDWKQRILMQSHLQFHVDSAISSTINLPEDITVEECAELFLEAWANGLKGVTIFRDGCKRAGILSVAEPVVETAKEKEEVKEVDKFQICEECGEPIEVIQGGCAICMNCGHSPC